MLDVEDKEGLRFRTVNSLFNSYFQIHLSRKIKASERFIFVSIGGEGDCKFAITPKPLVCSKEGSIGHFASDGIAVCVSIKSSFSLIYSEPLCSHCFLYAPVATYMLPLSWSAGLTECGQDWGQWCSWSGGGSITFSRELHHSMEDDPSFAAILKGNEEHKKSPPGSGPGSM